jgi:hypothetical protein
MQRGRVNFSFAFRVISLHRVCWHLILVQSWWSRGWLLLRCADSMWENGRPSSQGAIIVSQFRLGIRVVHDTFLETTVGLNGLRGWAYNKGVVWQTRHSKRWQKLSGHQRQHVRCEWNGQLLVILLVIFPHSLPPPKEIPAQCVIGTVLILVISEFIIGEWMEQIWAGRDLLV